MPGERRKTAYLAGQDRAAGMPRLRLTGRAKSAAADRTVSSELDRESGRRRAAEKSPRVDRLDAVLPQLKEAPRGDRQRGAA
jgi:hypothetical protein